MTKKRLIVLISIFFGLCIAIVAGYFIYRSIFSATINLYISPQSAEAKIGDNSGVFGDNFVRPGTYKVVISKKGFSTYSQEVTVKANEKVTVNAALTSTSPDTANWYNEHPDDYTIAQNIGDRQADKDMDNFVKGFPIVKALPIVGLYESYRVDYGPSPTKSGTFAVFISYQSDTAKQQAIDAVKAKGYDLQNYEVIYELSAQTNNSTTFVNTVALTNHGVSSDVLKRVLEVISARYPTSTVTFADDTRHSIEDEGITHVYTASYTVNTATEQIVIRVNSMTDLEISIDGQVLYTGTVL